VNIETELKKMRETKGLTQIEIAKKSNITKRSYQRYEYGERTPNVYTAQLIAQVLHAPVEKLFPFQASPNAGKENPNNSQENK